MSFSIVTISYNQGRFLRAAIESVLAQTGESIQYIVVDPGSTDDSRDIISEYAHEITAVLDKDAGPADGLNRGFALAEGKYLGYLNADDIFLPGALRQAREVLSDGQTHVVYGDGLMLGAQGEVIRPVHSDDFDPLRYARGAVTVLQQATFFTREAFLKTPGFNTQNTTCWDAELFVEMVGQGYMPKHQTAYWGGFRVHSDSITGSGRLTQQYNIDRTKLAEALLGRPIDIRDEVVGLAERVAKRTRGTWRFMKSGA
jgi:glycosyltransferase involved in cell wall biosynthesis